MIDLNINYQDPKPARISFEEWDDLFQRIPDALIEKFHYFPKILKPGQNTSFPPRFSTSMVPVISAA
jgi:hypothetical protein